MAGLELTEQEAESRVEPEVIQGETAGRLGGTGKAGRLEALAELGAAVALTEQGVLA